MCSRVRAGAGPGSMVKKSLRHGANIIAVSDGELLIEDVQMKDWRASSTTSACSFNHGIQRNFDSARDQKVKCYPACIARKFSKLPYGPFRGFTLENAKPTRENITSTDLMHSSTMEMTSIERQNIKKIIQEESGIAFTTIIGGTVPNVWSIATGNGA